jgi:hypothetical protein|tara:strand:- start:162 stop:368 length:207 start_codon:yes stop_codon:yes gene_type:complete
MNDNLVKCAQIILDHGQFKIIENGDYVLCSITKKKIPLEEIKYWNVDLQEIYAGPEIALQRYKEINGI